MGIRWPGWPAVVALLVVGVTMPAVAQQTWPQRTVKLIVPLGPGSGADIGARLMADRLSKRWGQPVIVENRPGGDAIPAIKINAGSGDMGNYASAIRRPGADVPATRCEDGARSQHHRLRHYQVSYPCAGDIEWRGSLSCEEGRVVGYQVSFDHYDTGSARLRRSVCKICARDTW